MNVFKTVLCPFPERKYEVLRLSALCKVRIGPEDKIDKIATAFQKRVGLSTKDDIHLACATHVDANAFLTCDDRLIRQSERLELGIMVMNPVDYVRQEVLQWKN